MCAFGTVVESVSGTILHVALLPIKDNDFVAFSYANTVKLDATAPVTTMIWPNMVPKKHIHLANEAGLTWSEDMCDRWRKAFEAENPEPTMRGFGGTFGATLGYTPLEVIKSGSYAVSFAESAADLSRIDRTRFPIQDDVLAALQKKYANAPSFTIFRIENSGKYHAFNMVFPLPSAWRKLTGAQKMSLMLQTLHIHPTRPKAVGFRFDAPSIATFSFGSATGVSAAAASPSPQVSTPVKIEAYADDWDHEIYLVGFSRDEFRFSLDTMDLSLAAHASQGQIQIQTLKNPPQEAFTMLLGYLARACPTLSGFRATASNAVTRIKLKGNLPNADLAITPLDSNSTIHDGIICDNCQTTPIEGSRHHCVYCHESVDLCGKCYSLGTYHENSAFRAHAPRHSHALCAFIELKTAGQSRKFDQARGAGVRLR